MPRGESFKVNLLSVIIPAYKQENTIVKDIKNVKSALEGLAYKYEIIVIVDGMVDLTYKRALKLKDKNVHVFGYAENQGKGYAVKFGMLKAKGDIIGFIDAGMDIHPSGLRMLLNHMEWYDADIIVGSKMHPVSQVKYPLYRKVLSWGYRLLTATLFGFKVRDTQVGLKFFKRKVLRDILPKMRIKSYAFDIEILALAYSSGYKRIFEAPIEINFNTSSIASGNLWKTIILMLWDTLKVFYSLKLVDKYKQNQTK